MAACPTSWSHIVFTSFLCPCCCVGGGGELDFHVLHGEPHSRFCNLNTQGPCRVCCIPTILRQLIKNQNLAGSDHCPSGMSPACCSMPGGLVGGASVSGEAGGSKRYRQSEEKFGVFDRLSALLPSQLLTGLLRRLWILFCFSLCVSWT